MAEYLNTFKDRILQNEKIIIIVGIILVIHIIFRVLKNNLRKEYYTTLGLGLNKENNEEIIFYYKKRYVLDSINFLITGAVIVFYLYSINVNFGLFSVAIGALILIIQPYIQSLIAFPIITTKYKIGDTIKIDDCVGDIIFMKALVTGITGRNLMGEHTGEVFTVPNSRFISTMVTRLDIKGTDIKKNFITFVYDYGNFQIPYPLVLEKLKAFLQDYLPLRTIEECGPFKSYIGHKFKMSSKYESKDLTITIAFLDTFATSRNTTQHIIGFIESFKIQSNT